MYIMSIVLNHSKHLLTNKILYMHDITKIFYKYVLWCLHEYNVYTHAICKIVLTSFNNFNCLTLYKCYI